MKQERKKPRKKPPVKLVAWGNNYHTAKQAFAEKTNELRESGKGADPGLKDGVLLFDVSIYWVFSLIQEEEKTKKIFKPDFLKKIFRSINFSSFSGYTWGEDYEHFFYSAIAFLEICYDYNLCFGLYEYEQKFYPKAKKQEGYIARVTDFMVYYTLNNQLIKYLPHRNHVAYIGRDLYETLLPGDKIEINTSSGDDENWRITRIL